MISKKKIDSTDTLFGTNPLPLTSYNPVGPCRTCVYCGGQQLSLAKNKRKLELFIACLAVSTDTQGYIGHMNDKDMEFNNDLSLVWS